MLPDPQDMKVNLYIRPYVDGRLEKVKCLSYENHKHMLVLNEVAKNIGVINGAKLGREQFKASSDMNRDSFETKKSIARNKMLRKCLKMRRADSSTLRNTNISANKFGRYGGVALNHISRDIDIFASPEFRKLEKLQKAQERMQSGQSKGFILQNEQILHKCHDYLEQRWGVTFPKPKIQEDKDKWKNIVHPKVDVENLPPIFKFYKPHYAKPKPLKQIKPHYGAHRKPTRSIMITDFSDAHSHISIGEKSRTHRADISVISAGTRPKSTDSFDDQSVVVPTPRNVGGTRRLSNVGLLDEPPINAVRRMSIVSMNSEMSHHLSVPDPDNYLSIKEADFIRLQSAVREDSPIEELPKDSHLDKVEEEDEPQPNKLVLPKIVVAKSVGV